MIRYAELEDAIHHACIAKLGLQLFTTETNGDLHEQVHRAVTEQLALDRRLTAKNGAVSSVS